MRKLAVVICFIFSYVSIHSTGLEDAGLIGIPPMAHPTFCEGILAGLEPASGCERA